MGKTNRVRWEGGLKYVSPITNEEMIENLSHSLFHLHCSVENISENNSIRIKIPISELTVAMSVAILPCRS